MAPEQLGSSALNPLEISWVGGVWGFGVQGLKRRVQDFGVGRRTGEADGVWSRRTTRPGAPWPAGIGAFQVISHESAVAPPPTCLPASVIPLCPAHQGVCPTHGGVCPAHRGCVQHTIECVQNTVGCVQHTVGSAVDTIGTSRAHTTSRCAIATRPQHSRQCPQYSCQYARLTLPRARNTLSRAGHARSCVGHTL